MSSLFKTDDIKLTAEVTKKKKKNKTLKISNPVFDVRHGKRYQTVAQAVGKLKMGESIHYASMGEWSNHELMQYILDQIGPAALYFCTWSVSENAVRSIIKNFTDNIILSLTAVLDWRVKVRRPEVLSLLQFNFAQLRLTSCHAKCFVLENNNYQVAVVGSANFTNNPRIEAGVICCDSQAAGFHKNWIIDEYEKSYPFEEKKEKNVKQKTA